MHIDRSLTVDTPTERVFAFLADFTTTEQWDPGTVRTVREQGDGGPGTVYRNVSRFLGRRTELRYVTEEIRAPELIRLRGENRSVVAHDTMQVRPAGAGRSHVHYRAEFEFAGAARWLAPVLRLALYRLGVRAERRLRTTLATL